MRGIFMLAGLIFSNVTLTANLAGARPQQELEQAALPQSAPNSSSSNSIEPLQLKFPENEITEKSDWHLNQESSFRSVSKRLFSSQKEIWTSPARIRWTDAEWLVPVAGITSGMILTDASFSHSVSNNPTTLKQFNEIRTGSVAVLGAASGGLYFWSLYTHDPHQRETGLLAGEAIFDTLALTEGVKFVAGRKRPYQGNGDGNFFSGGSSFPSGHSAAAWAAAGILAHEYPGTLTKLLAYGLATTVSIASVGSKQHFPSDVVIGSGVGWLVSEYVYRAHHNPELGGSAWSPISALVHGDQGGPTQYPGSTYVPLDSWVYPAFDRLAALGYANDAIEGTRPWSRDRCAHLLQDAEEVLGVITGSSASVDTQTRELLVALHHEFAREEASFTSTNKSAEIDSLYTRVLSANGLVLTDGFHFGQTYAYDFGRPLRRGTNFIAGGSASATYGSLFFYVGGEYQHAPAAPALSPAEIQFIADADKAAPPSGEPFAAINQFQFLDAYAGINFHNIQISFGNQSLSWGPGIGGSLLLSNNAAPFPMLRISSASPVEIRGLSKVTGPLSIEQFYGRVDGHPGFSQPWIYGQKVSIKPLHSLEFAYARTTLVGGSGHPLTSRTFLDSMFGRVDPTENSVPGDSRVSMEWTWRPPKIGNLVSFYGEIEDDDGDEVIHDLSKSVLRPGMYIPRLPFLSKCDLHFEWASSTSPGHRPFQGHGDLNYWNLDYTSGYTNNGGLMGNTVGREGVTLQAWTRYWISPRNALDFSWKQSRVLSNYIPGGGKWLDYQASYSRTSRSGLYLKGFLQLEHISSFPLLFSGARNNVVASVELGFLPQWGKRQSTPSTATAKGVVAQSTGASR
jgi:membrane-associated phospholipid phosphatase